jgi:hypothetical protein
MRAVFTKLTDASGSDNNTYNKIPFSHLGEEIFGQKDKGGAEERT